MLLKTLKQDVRDELGNVRMLEDFDEAERLANRGDIEELSMVLDGIAEDLRHNGLDELVDELNGFEDQFRFE